MTAPTLFSVSTPGGEVACSEWAGDHLAAGTPTVALLTGLGVSSLSWWSTQDPAAQALLTEPYFLAPALAERFRVLAYDRAGAGERASPQKPRTLDDLLGELGAVLEALAPAPVILVGHSVGGLVAFEYARRHPRRVDGLALLDASHPHQRERLDRWRPPGEQAAYRTLVTRLRTEHPERLDFGTLFSEGHSVQGVLRALPLLVVSRGIRATAEELQVGTEPLPSGAAEHLAAEWDAMQADLASASARGRHLIAQRSRHYPHFDDPRWTAAGLLTFLDTLG